MVQRRQQTRKWVDIAVPTSYLRPNYSFLVWKFHPGVLELEKKGQPSFGFSTAKAAIVSIPAKVR
jgi:hypothetical protein